MCMGSERRVVVERQSRVSSSSPGVRVMYAHLRNRRARSGVRKRRVWELEVYTPNLRIPPTHTHIRLPRSGVWEGKKNPDFLYVQLFEVRALSSDFLRRTWPITFCPDCRRRLIHRLSLITITHKWIHPLLGSNYTILCTSRYKLKPIQPYSASNPLITIRGN